MAQSRQLQQATSEQPAASGPLGAAPAPAQAMATPPASPSSIRSAPSPSAAANVTVVRTAQELQAASLNGAVDIEIRAHLDLSNLTRPANPAMPGKETFQNRKHLALIYASSPLRSIRGNCSEPNPAVALGLSADLAPALLPLRPRQCLLLLPDTWLMVNDGTLWLENLYLRAYRTLANPIFTFIQMGARDASQTDSQVAASANYITRLTFQPDGRGTTIGLTADINDISAVVDDCVFTNWMSFRSPFVVQYQSVFHIRNTVLRNFNTAAEIADVSFEGIVHFSNVSLANVTLQNGAVVSTTLNNYQFATGYALTYYAEDDEEYDVPLTAVPTGEASMWGEEFVIVNATMSDCVYLLALDDTVYPGCPASSTDRRVAVRERAFDGAGETSMVLADGTPDAAVPFSAVAEYQDGEELFPAGAGAGDYEYSYYLGPVGEYLYDYDSKSDPNVWFVEKFLDMDDPWIVATQQALGPLPAAPAGWPAFTVDPAPFSNRTSAERAPAVIPPDVAATIVQPLDLSLGPEVGPDSPTDDGGVGGGTIAGIVLAALAALCLCALAVWRYSATSKRQRPGDLKAGATGSAGGGSEEAMLVAFTSGMPTATHALDASPDEAARALSAKLTRGALIPEDYPADDADMPNSVMNPSQQYIGPTALIKPGTKSSSSDDLKPYATSQPLGVHEVPSVEAPDLIDMSTGQSTDATVSRPLTRNASGADTVLGSHHMRMMQGLTTPDTPPVIASDRASTEGYTPMSLTHVRDDLTGAEAAAAVHQTEDGTIDDSGTVDGTIDQSSDSEAEGGDKVEAAAAPPALSAGEIWAKQGAGPHLSLAPTIDMAQTSTNDSFSDQAIKRVLKQLDGFGKKDLLLGRFQVLGRQQQRLGGQAVVQFVRGSADRRHYAVKFFLHPDAFFVEAALYAACFPEIQQSVSPEVAARAVDVAAASGGDGIGDGIGAVAIPAAAARFLPQVEAVCDGTAGDLVDAQGRQLPPCIVMEKGESLQDWSSRAEPDFFTVLAVLSHISLRVADMHDAGYVHRDLKPANVMWLPRENRWTVIDFGCVAGIGEVASLSFTLAYAAPEVVEAYHTDQRMIESTPALDAWSLGVMAYELLTGSPAYDFLTHGRCRVIAQLRGELPLPWEEDIGDERRHQLGAFKGPVLQLLARDPAQRVSMRRFHDICTKLFASRTTVESDV